MSRVLEETRCLRALRLVVLPLLTGFLLQPPGPASAQVPVPGWDVAGPYPAEGVNRESYPNFYAVFLAPWRELAADPQGLLDLALHVPRENPLGNLVLARTVFWSGQEEVVNLEVGYAGELDVFFNGWRVFSGIRPNALPDRSPMASVGCSDQIPLYVKKGLNEILLMATSRADAWAFRAATGKALEPRTTSHASAREEWATSDAFLTSESVLKDPDRDVLYVTSFDNEYTQKPEPSGYISKLSLSGEILDLRWVEGLHAPTGMAAWGDTLYVAEREHLLAVEMATGEVIGRWPIPDPVFPNDVAVDDEGTVYISDTRTGDWAQSRIYRFREGRFDVFANEGISRANGLWVHDGWLLVGSSGDGYLKRVELATGRVESIVSMGAGIIDGIRVDPRGNFLVSLWEGQLYRITPEGRFEQLLDALPDGWNTADFEYLPEEGLILMPTFLDNRVRAIRIVG